MFFDPIRCIIIMGRLLQIVMGTMIPLIRSEEKEHWFRIIPRNNIPDTTNIFVWHRSEGFETLIYYGKERALSVFFIQLC